MSAPQRPDHAARDRGVAVTLYTTIVLRAVVARKVATAYWLDVHGPLVSRSPGLHCYVQHHFARSHDDHLWPLPDGVGPAPAYHLDGAVEVGFADAAGMTSFVGAAAVLGRDERNVFEQTVAYADTDGASTLLDRQAEPYPNGHDGLDRVHVHFFARPGAEAELAGYLRDELAPTYARHPDVEKVRVHTPAPYDNDKPAPPSPGVDHRVPPERRSLAVLEMAFPDPLARRRFHASENYLGGLAGQASYAAHVSAFAVRGCYVYVRDGRLSTQALRGSHAADLIAALAAANQVEDEVRRRFVPAPGPTSTPTPTPTSTPTGREGES